MQDGAAFVRMCLATFCFCVRVWLRLHAALVSWKVLQRGTCSLFGCCNSRIVVTCLRRDIIACVSYFSSSGRRVKPRLFGPIAHKAKDFGGDPSGAAISSVVAQLSLLVDSDPKQKKKKKKKKARK